MDLLDGCGWGPGLFCLEWIVVRVRNKFCTWQLINFKNDCMERENNEDSIAGRIGQTGL